MAKCKCGSQRWRKKAQRTRSHGYEYLIVCLTCEWEWWSSAQYASQLPRLSQEEREELEHSFP